MNLDWKVVREKVFTAVITTVVLGALGIFANWASQGSLVRALGGASSRDADVSLRTMRELQSQIAEITQRTDTGAGSQTMRELQSQIAEIKKKTDNICFLDQLGRAVLYPCNTQGNP
jgi:hypothetical protein